MENDEYLFSEEIEIEIQKEEIKILVVDDEVEVHNVTKLALEDFLFENKKMKILSAFSGIEAIEILKNESEIAVILLDVIMEDEDSGLKVAKFLRNDINNHLTRIILRTGQPGQVLEEKVTIEYDINDYRVKTELTAKKLYTTMIVALRNYRDLKKIDEMNKNLELIVENRTFELKKALEKLRLAQNEIIISEKMVSMGKLLDGIAHELSSPFGAVLTSVQMMKNDVSTLNRENCEDSKVSINENIDIVEEGVKKANSIIMKLMQQNEFTNYDIEKRRSDVNIKDLLINTLEMICDIYETENKISDVKKYVELEEELIVKANEIKLLQAFYAIMENALDALNGKNGFEEKYIRIRSYRKIEDKNRIIVEIEDNGRGISEEMKVRIFDPFFTTKDIGRGMGLGLTKSYYTLKNYGAKIDVISKEGEGTKFVVEFIVC